MPLTVGHIPYISCEPFYFAMEKRGIALHELVPSAVADAALAGVIDAAPVPLVDCTRLSEHFRYLSGFCVATIHKAGSAHLHSRQPIDALAGACIQVSAEAATATRLLQMLLTLKYQIQPATYVPHAADPDALLFVGNAALSRRHGVKNYPYLYDLGEEWAQWTRLPFVFLRWMVRKSADPKAVAVLEDTLYTGLQDWADGLFRSSTAREDVLMHPRDLLEYTQRIRYFLGVPEQRGIELFQRHLEQLALSS